MSATDRAALGDLDALSIVLDDRLRPSGLRIDGVELTTAGNRRILRIAVDRDLRELTDETSAVPPMSLDEIAEASEVISSELDGRDVLGPAAYTLEVSSPGVMRPLTEPRHYRRNVTRLLVVSPREGADFTARLLRAGADDITLARRPEAKKGARVRPEDAWDRLDLPYDAVRRARVEVEFGRTADWEALEAAAAQAPDETDDTDDDIDDVIDDEVTDDDGDEE